MKLLEVRIGNYRAIGSRTLSFCDLFGRPRPVTVLAGPNGSGKTSVLLAIVQALRGVVGYRTDDVDDPNPSEIRKSGSPGNLSALPVKFRVTLTLQFSKDEQDAIREVARPYAVREEPEGKTRLSRLPDLPGGRLVVSWEYPPPVRQDGTPQPVWHVSTEPRNGHEWLWGRREAVQAKRDRVPGKLHLHTRIGGLLLFPQDRNLRDRVVGHPDIQDDIQARPEQPIWGILKYLGGYANAPREKPLSDEQNWEKQVKDRFHAICGPKQYEGYLYPEGDFQGAPYLRDGDSPPYPLSMAASGEQVVLEYVTRLTYPNPFNCSIILIDEPEVHLHPAWVRSLYLALPKMGQDNQFIVTTHSAELRALAAEDGSLIDFGELGS